MANGQLKPTLGNVSVRGIDAWIWRRRLVGYCPDVDAFYEISGPAVRLGDGPALWLHAEPLDRTEPSLERVGMRDRADRKLRGYSKGMRQRIKLRRRLSTTLNC